jgi:ABC-type bacteriocin/lantibiotic exporter with double-glycine peptidase domain
MRDLFSYTQSQVVDRELYRKRNNLIADRKASLFDILMKVIIFGYVFYCVKKGKTLDAFAIYYVSSRVCNYIRSFGQCVVQQNENSQALNYITEIMNVSNSEKKSDEQKFYPNISNGIEIEFRNVDFCYPREKSYVFKNLNLKIVLDKFWGLQGYNGNGKTTLLKLITGYLKPDNGDIYINKINVKNIKRKWFSDTFASYHPEMSMTHSVTVKEFLTVDQLDSSLDYSGKMFDVLAEVGLRDKFEGLDLSKVVLDPGHPQGTDLSSGQAQRLLIARLIMNLIAGAKYILADEMTSNISFNDQTKLICLLKKYSNNGIIIAHNPDIINLCDEVILCEENKLKIIKCENSFVCS